MQSIISNIKSYLTYKPKVRTDNFIFLLHKVTAGVLLFFSLVTSTAFLLKEPIECISDDAVSRVINVYCWIHATYTLPEALNTGDDRALAKVAHPGVAPHHPDDESTTQVHKYYQWVCFFLFAQAIAFYIPRWLWKNILEGGRMKVFFEKDVLNDLNNDDKAKGERKKAVEKYFRASLGTNDDWSSKFALCEVLNFINVIVQIELTDRFVGRALSKYGFSLFQYRRQDPMWRTDNLAVAFPTVTKCRFNMVGPSGSIVGYDALCVLPFNIYNEKLFPILWAWFIVLAVLSGLAIVYRFTTFLFPELRYQLMRRNFHIPESLMDAVWELDDFHYGDWFLLDLIGKNMGPVTFIDFVEQISKPFESKDHYPYRTELYSDTDTLPISGKEKAL